MIARKQASSGAVRAAAAVVAAVFLVGCSGSDTAPPARGSIRATVTTTGANIDPDGYELDVFGGSTRSITIPANNEVLIADLTAGQYDVQLRDLAANCSVNGSNPVQATVVVGDTVSVAFAVDCP
jgi:major membrane immunogen (membrane-anchored lipoprotein)